MHRSPYILSASANLLGICFIILTGLKLANAYARSYADEVAWLAALFLFIALLHAYLAIRNQGARRWQEEVADIAFLGGVTALAVSVIIAAVSL
jgi:cellobiose-specific phosphotransferase system component IIC